jgi:hypothetical protein
LTCHSAKTGIDKIWHGNHRYTDEDATNHEIMAKLVEDLDNPKDIWRMPGIVNIPSCSWLEIQDNWKKGITDDNRGTYPCNGVQ